MVGINGDARAKIDHDLKKYKNTLLVHKIASFIGEDSSKKCKKLGRKGGILMEFCRILCINSRIDQG